MKLAKSRTSKNDEKAKFEQQECNKLGSKGLITIKQLG
jgi:hypothetical protein